MKNLPPSIYQLWDVGFPNIQTSVSLNSYPSVNYMKFNAVIQAEHEQDHQK